MEELDGDRAAQRDVFGAQTEPMAPAELGFERVAIGDDHARCDGLGWLVAHQEDCAVMDTTRL